MDTITALLERARGLLQGDPARVITFGAVAVVWLVTHIGFALGLLHQPPSFDAILAVVTAAILALNEGIRMFTFSPASVAVIQATAAAAGAQAAGAGPATVVTTTAPAISTTAEVTPDPAPVADGGDG